MAVTAVVAYDHITGLERGQHANCVSFLPDVSVRSSVEEPAWEFTQNVLFEVTNSNQIEVQVGG